MNKLDLSKGISVKVENIKEAQSVLKICEKLGMTWVYGNPLTNRWPIITGVYPRYLDIKDVVSNNYDPRYQEIKLEKFLDTFAIKEVYITQEGNTVHAIMKKNGEVVKRKKAICSEEDDFDLETGVNLAIRRLFGHYTNKAYSCKVACMVSWQPAFTLDKIYTVKNGEIIDNNGVAWGLETKIKSLKDLNSLCGAKFIEIEN